MKVLLNTNSISPINTAIPQPICIKETTNLGDYLEPQYTAMAYMQNYPSFTPNKCLVPAKFYATKKKRSTRTCPFAHKSHGQ